MVRKETVPDEERGGDAQKTVMFLDNDNNGQQVCPPEYDLADKDPMLWCVPVCVVSVRVCLHIPALISVSSFMAL